MSKILLFSDLHCHIHKGQLSRLDDCLEALEWVFKTAIDKKITDIIFAGDLFQDRQKIHVISYEKTFRLIRQYCEKYQDLRLFMLVGNHDMWYSEKWDVSSIAPLEAITNVKVINNPCSIKISNSIIDFLPYTKNPLEDIKIHFPKKNDILVSHCSIDGACLNSVYNTKAEISVEFEGDMTKVGVDTFNGWKKVFLGHYHCAQKLNDVVEYIGSPLELNFGEAHQQKHIIVLDSETLNTEYVINTFSPKHLIIKEADIDQYDLKNNFIQILVDDITSTNMVDMKKSNKGFATMEFKEKKKKKEDVLVEKIDFSSGKVLEGWINAKGCGKLDRDKLLSIGQSIVEKV